MRPNTEGDYDIEVEVDPYFVRTSYGDTIRIQDGISEYGGLGTTPSGEPRIYVASQMRMNRPDAYWETGIRTGVGGKIISVFLGGVCYGDWSITLNLWNSYTDSWRTHTVHFLVENPCDYNSDHGGYLIGGGMITSRSEFHYDQPGYLDVPRPVGTVEYYISNREPQVTDIVDIVQVYKKVRSSDSTYGSPYLHAPVNLISMRLQGYGDESCWPGDCSNRYTQDHTFSTRISVLASEISALGCKKLNLTSGFTVAPISYKTSGSSTIGLSYTHDADTLVSPLARACTIGNVSGSGHDFTVMDTPMSQNVRTTRICVIPDIPVLINGFTVEVVDGRVEIAWQVAEDGELVGFDIYRRSDGVIRTELVNQSGPLDKDERRFIDPNVDVGSTYCYTLASRLLDGSEIRSREISVTVAGPKLQLLQNKPNPFSPSTTISFSLPDTRQVSLSIYDVRGKLVKTLVDAVLDVGPKAYVWDGTNEIGNAVGSGIYLYRLTAGKQVFTKKMMLIR
jgi:hypothetical protein